MWCSPVAEYGFPNLISFFQDSFNDLQEEQAVKVLDPWYDITKDFDTSEAINERGEKPVAINVDVTPYRMQIAKKPIVWKNNFSKRSVSMFSDVDFRYNPFHIACRARPIIGFTDLFNRYRLDNRYRYNLWVFTDLFSW